MDLERPELTAVLVDVVNFAGVTNTDGVETYFLTLRSLAASPGGELVHPVAFRAAMSRASLTQLSETLASILNGDATTPATMIKN